MLNKVNSDCESCKISAESRNKHVELRISTKERLLLGNLLCMLKETDSPPLVKAVDLPH